MKKIYVIIILSFFLEMNILNADCIESKKEGDQISILIDPPRVDKQELSLLVVVPSNNIYLKITNDYNNEEKIYTNEKENATTFKLVSPDIYSNIKYTIRVYYSDTACGLEPIITYEYETGIYNKYNQSNACLNASSYIERCKEYYTSEDIKNFNISSDLSEDKHNELVESDIENKNNMPEEKLSTKEKILKGIKEYYLYILIPIAIISLMYIIQIIIIKRRKKYEKE